MNTSRQAMSASETWHKVEAEAELYICCCADGEHMGPEYLATVYDMRSIDSETTADQIIRDHNAAQQLAVAVEALTKIKESIVMHGTKARLTDLEVWVSSRLTDALARIAELGEVAK